LPEHLKAEDKPTRQFIGGFIWRRFWSQGYPWVDHQLALSWTLEQKLSLLLKIPAEKDTWTRAGAVLGKRESEYWRQARINPWGFEIDEAREAAEKLTAYEQPAAAIDCLYILADKKAPIPINLASSVLLAAAKSEEQQRRIDQHHIKEVIKWLQDQEPPESQELFLIEWQFLPLLNRLHGAEPKVLERRLASSPTFFCEVIAAVFRSEKDEEAQKREPTELETRIAQNAYSLLHGWRILPGATADGGFDGTKFTSWLNEVKALCKESGHLRIALDQLGQALAYAPEDSSGLWIHRAVAAALDSRDVAEMRRAFAVGHFNRRGVHGFSEGAEEKKIADGYRQKAQALLDNGFHRLADTVRGLAQEYEGDASAPRSALKALGVSKTPSLMRVLVDTALVTSMALGHKGRMWLHAAPEGGDLLFDFYKNRCKLQHVQKGTRIPKMPRPFMGVPSDGRHFFTTPRLARELINELQENRKD